MLATGNFGLICNSGTPTTHFFLKPAIMSEESWITPKFPVIANFKRSTGDFLFTERRLMKKFQPNTDRYVIML